MGIYRKRALANRRRVHLHAIDLAHARNHGGYSGVGEAKAQRDFRHMLHGNLELLADGAHVVVHLLPDGSVIFVQ